MSLPTSLPFQPQFNYPNNKLYQNEVYPVSLSLSFQVDSSDPTGITDLTGSGIANVFMHTSTTPDVGNYGIVNPNPDEGVILIQLQNNFNKLLGLSSMLQPPLTGSDLSVKAADAALNPGQPYQITVLGSTTLANWQTLGLPAGVTPAVGQPFIAAASGAGTGTGKVKAFGVSSCVAIQPLGISPLLSMSNIYQNGGAQIIIQTLFPTIDTGALKSPLVKSALEDTTQVSMQILLSNSSVTVAGQ